MQLNGLDALGDLNAFDFGSILTSIGNEIKTQAPALIKAAAQKQVARLTAPVAAPMQTPVVTQAPASPRAAAPSAPGVPTKYIFIGGGLLLAGALIFVVAR